MSRTSPLTTSSGADVDDPNKRGEPDRSRISLTEDYEVRYWTKKFGCTPDELKDAVEQVGHMAADVEALFGDCGE